MKRAARRWLLLGVVTFVFGLIALFPARIAINYFVPDVVSISGIEGSVWAGSAREISASGLYARDLRWRFSPARLLRGQLAYRIEATPPGGFIDGTFAANIGGSIQLLDTRAALPLAILAAAVNVRGLDGTANLTVDTLELRDGLPVRATGTAEVNSLVIPTLYRGSIGGYRAEFFTQESGVAASVEDTDGLVDIAGSLELRPDRSFQFLALLAAKTETPPSVRQQMQFLGSANERGQHELRLEGSL